MEALREPPLRVGRSYVNTKTSGVYRLNALAKHTETSELEAVYTCLETYTFEGRTVEAGTVFVRPAAMFAGRRADGRRYFELAEDVPRSRHDPILDAHKLYTFAEFTALAKEDLDMWFELFGLDKSHRRRFYDEPKTYDEWYRAYHQWGSW